MGEFSTLLKMANAKGTIKGIRMGRSGLFLTHLFFADHSIFFMEASLDGANTIKSVVTEYEGVSRQLINFEKSLIFFSNNVLSGVREHIGAVLGMRVSCNAEKYLGLSTMVGRRKKEAFASFKDKFMKHIESRSVHQLSLGGHPSLYNAMLFVTCYFMSDPLVRLEENVQAESIRRDLAKFKIVLLAKQGCRLVMRSDCLFAQVMKAKHYLNNDFMIFNLGSHSSYTWRSTWGGRRLLELGMGWNVGNYRMINIGMTLGYRVLDKEE
ncbi:reverse transcriptase [Gossypium australe]|uniref:Reverse transcriptase n=1 Tax=Gossypium australe TaxID=47621 RepID=A0A5B6X0Z4_9ROSI|nr:reverse transcriptase [Gossypium australe]